MREIIHLQVGQCGNQVRGRSCVFDLNVFYSQALNGRFVPRALLIDLYLSLPPS